jgi:hypothetical protein
MPITKEAIRAKIIEHLKANPDAIGYDSVLLVRDFIEREKICPQAVIEVLHDLGEEQYSLGDGRMCMISNPAPITFCDRFTIELWAQKHLHAGGIKCVPGGL